MTKRPETCTASDLVAQLTRLIADHGDRDVWLRDPDTDWLMVLDLNAARHLSGDDRELRDPEDTFGDFVLKSDYSGAYYE